MLGQITHQVMKHLQHIWKFDVVLEQENTDGQVFQIATSKKPATV